jgi:hypothetical protein
MNQAESPAPEVKKISALEARLQTPLGLAIVGLSLFIFFTAIFYFSPLSTGFDWTIIRAAIYRTISGQEIYQIYDSTGVFNPPWLFLLITPLGLLPERFGWAAMNAISILSIVLLARRYQLDIFKVIFLLASPPFLYNLLQGQVDVLILLTVFLPDEWLPLAAAMKPQLLLPLCLRVIHNKKFVWLKATLITAIGLGLSFLFFGLWHIRLLQLSQDMSMTHLGHNVLYAIWPLPLIVAVPLILLGLERKDERFYLAAGPLMSSYASTGSFMGILLAAAAALKNWQVAAMVVTWWLVYLIR